VDFPHIVADLGSLVGLVNALLQLAAAGVGLATALLLHRQTRISRRPDEHRDTASADGR